MTFGAPIRRLVGLAIAIATGLGSAILDTGPGFDDTGVLVTGLVVGSALAAFTAGRAPLPWRKWNWLRRAIDETLLFTRRLQSRQPDFPA